MFGHFAVTQRSLALIAVAGLLAVPSLRACGPDFPSSYLETDGEATLPWIDFGFSLLDIAGFNDTCGFAYASFRREYLDGKNDLVRQLAAAPAAEVALEAMPGVLPEKLSVPVPPPGESVTLAWFRAAPCPAAITAMPDAESK